MHILLIDDSPNARSIMKALLEFEGHTVSLAEDGLAGLAAIEQGGLDAALVDIQLPGIDGYQVVERARLAPHGSSLLLIALTGFEDEHDRARAARAGFDDYLIKPVEPDVLLEMLNRPRRSLRANAF